MHASPPDPGRGRRRGRGILAAVAHSWAEIERLVVLTAADAAVFVAAMDKYDADRRAAGLPEDTSAEYIDRQPTREAFKLWSDILNDVDVFLNGGALAIKGRVDRVMALLAAGSIPAAAFGRAIEVRGYAALEHVFSEYSHSSARAFSACKDMCGDLIHVLASNRPVDYLERDQFFVGKVVHSLHFRTPPPSTDERTGLLNVCFKHYSKVSVYLLHLNTLDARGLIRLLMHHFAHTIDASGVNVGLEFAKADTLFTF